MKTFAKTIAWVGGIAVMTAANSALAQGAGKADHYNNGRDCWCDRNLDQTTDILDLLQFLSVWFDSNGNAVTPGTGADADHSGRVNVLDYLLYLDGCAFTQTPCPTADVETHTPDVASN